MAIGHTSAPRRDATRTAVPVAALALALVTVTGAWLRELPLFWRNAGGYPIWLRDAVRDGFAPLAVLGVAACAVATTGAAARCARGQRVPPMHAAAVIAAVVLNLMAATVVAFR